MISVREKSIDKGAESLGNRCAHFRPRSRRSHAEKGEELGEVSLQKRDTTSSERANEFSHMPLRVTPPIDFKPAHATQSLPPSSTAECQRPYGIKLARPVNKLPRVVFIDPTTLYLGIRFSWNHSTIRIGESDHTETYKAKMDKISI